MGMFNVVTPEQFAAALEAVGLDASWDERSRQGSTVAVCGQEVGT
jgi:hypothetical protein